MNQAPFRDSSLAPSCETSTALNSPDDAKFFFNLGKVCFRLDNETKAFEWLQKALSIREKTLPRGHADVLTVIEQIAWVHNQAGHRAEACAWFGKLLALLEEVEGVDAQATQRARSLLDNMSMLFKNDKYAW